MRAIAPRKGGVVRRRNPATALLTRGIAWAALAMGLAARGGTAPPASEHPVWPPPPAEPALVYVQSITCPADIGVQAPSLSRLAHWITGAKADSRALIKPFGLAIDDAGGLVVTDTGANAVCYLDRARKKWLHWDHAGQTRFESPVAAVRHGGTFFVADSALGKVIAFDEKGKQQFEITGDLERPSGLALSGDKIFIADALRQQIVVCDLNGVVTSRFGRRGEGPGEFNFPTHVAADPSGRLLVTDSLNRRIEVFDASGRLERIIGSPGDGPGHFSRPKGVAADSGGHIYVVDAMFGNVQVFDLEGRLLLDWGQTGSGLGEFWLPNAIAISHSNDIYVADAYNRRIQVFKYTGKP